MQWSEPVARVWVADEDVLPEIEWIVTIVGKKVGVGITREGEGGKGVKKERGGGGWRGRERGRERHYVCTYQQLRIVHHNGQSDCYNLSTYV